MLTSMFKPTITFFVFFLLLSYEPLFSRSYFPYPALGGCVVKTNCES